ncbi:uncharacterized protein LOC114254628 [Monomorium pharaonis]|uniref:uncharacterized protein LOC114254628 n=1 Tax=Monomorium pharaonis TaxID=307658 RepID=UPI00174655E0|nr:uncharacterized protein LOC114254628 [Monomorium pharaonis]
MSVPKRRKIFDIVQFIDNDNENEKKSIDCVPSLWIFFDEEIRQIKTKFMPPLYSSKKCNVLHKMVQKNVDPLSTWPSYRINLIKSAGTYSEALSIIEKLKNEEYVYTTDTEENRNTENANIYSVANHNYILPPVQEMKGNLTICRSFSSSDSSIENDTETCVKDNVTNKNSRDCRVTCSHQRIQILKV